MTLLTHRGGGPWFRYVGQPMHVLAGQHGQPPGSAAMEIAVPPHFAGPIPHAHDAFDEAIYVLSGRLLVVGDDEPQQAAPGSMFVAPAGSGAASAIRPQSRPRCSGSGRRRNPQCECRDLCDNLTTSWFLHNPRITIWVLEARISRPRRFLDLLRHYHPASG
jgi:cupin domain